MFPSSGRIQSPKCKKAAELCGLDLTPARSAITVGGRRDAGRGLRSGVGQNKRTGLSWRALWIALACAVKRFVEDPQEERTSCVCVTTPHNFPASDFTCVCHTIVVLPR